MILWQDLRYATRLLVKDRWFTLVAVLALSLGIGLNTAVFTLVNAVLLRGLPYGEPHRIMHLNERNQPRDQEFGVSYLDYQDWRRATKTFADLAAFQGGTMNISDAGRPPERAAGAWVSANTFRHLGQPLRLGRDFATDEDTKGAEPVVVLGHGLWKTRYGSDPGILGRVIRINEVSSTIVGVMPEGVRFPDNADLWQPLQASGDRDKREARNLGVFGRLKPGVTLAEAQAEMATITSQLAQQYPDTNKDVAAVVMTYNDRFNGGPIKLVFLSLMGAVGFVLLIACANVANLLLARSAHRAREVAVRVAMGASRWRVVRQLLVESILLGILSGGVGLLLSFVGIRAFDAAVADVGKPYWIRFTLDFTVFAYLAAVCVLTSVIFGLAPALHVSKTNVNDVLKEGGRMGSGGRRARRMTTVMVVAELALTIVLLTGAGLMVRSFLKMYTLDLGIDPDRLLTMRLGLAERKYPTPASWVEFHERLAERLNAAAGVEAATVASALPLGGGPRRSLEIEGRALAPGDRAPDVSVISAGLRYFDAIGVTARKGRVLNATDGTPGAEAAVVNERFAARFFPDTDPVGQRIRLTEDRGKPSAWIAIVGVTPSIRQRDLQEIDPDAVVYLPFRQDPVRFANLIVRARQDPASLATTVRQEVQATDPDQPVYNVNTMNEVLARARWPFRVFGSMFAIFAAIALILSAVGIYAVMAYAVTQRTQEIGVRIALGARAGHVSWLVLRQGIIQLCVGLVLGLAGGFGVSRLLQSLLVQVPPTDPVTFLSVTGLLVFVTVAACLLPVRRATRLDPLAALRAE
jgi:predicted permease